MLINWTSVPQALKANEGVKAIIKSAQNECEACQCRHLERALVQSIKVISISIVKIWQGVIRLRTKLLAMAVCLFLLLTVMIVSVASTYAVGEGEWITKYTVKDSKTDQVLMEVDFETGTNNTYYPILAGAELTVTFTVNVVVTGGDLRLSTSMLHSQVHDTFWSLVTLNYTFSNYNPNSAAVDFSAVKGTFEMICYGRIANYTVTNIPVPVTLVMLSSSGGDVLDQIRPNVVNAKVDEYQKLLETKEAKLQSLKDSGVAPGYIELFGNVIDQAKAEAAQGYVDNAIALLNALAVSSEPASSVMESLFLPIIGVLAAVAVVLGFVFMRSRGKVNYVLSVIEDQIKDLEGLTLRASKIDRTISSSLETIKDRLMRLVGA
jgi:hypothetical protein